jgi:glutamine synthetase
VTLEELREQVEGGRLDTVLLALPDMQTRLMGKAITARNFLDHVVDEAAEGCKYILATDVEMGIVPGYDLVSLETGFGDFVLRPDLGTLRPVPWHEGTAICVADAVHHDGTPVSASPRQVLRRQLERLREHGWGANASTELEFIVFRDTYEEAWHKAYRGLEPASLYNVDYSIFGATRVEPLIRRIRNSMAGAEMYVEHSKGECNLGQYEINLRYADPLTTADQHVIYKNGAKEIASQQGASITFMAKFDENEGSSGHVHFSLTREGGGNVFAEDEEVFERFLAGQLASLNELTLFFAPHINSYKRFIEEQFAPTAIAWGYDNRTTALRAVGHGEGKRLENRMPGADVNPYLALAAVIAGGLHGVDADLKLEPAFDGNAYTSDKPRVPDTLRAARDLFTKSALAREAFGDEVVDHYVNMADVELREFDSAVTDWERFRGFERL